MEEKSSTFQIGYYIRLVFKHRWFIIIPVCLSMVVGIYLAIKLPKVYQAKTLILITPQRVPAEFVRNVIGMDLHTRISTISQQILSHSNLTKIIEKFGLYSDPKYSGMFAEDMVKSLRKNIKVRVNRDRRRRETNSFSISFMGPDPEKVMEVTNGIGYTFIEENIRVRESQAVGTSDFLGDESQTVRKRLEDVEEQLREYRKKYIGELPEQLQSNLKILENEQRQKADLEERLSDEKSRLIEIENLINERRELLASGSGIDEMGDAANLVRLKNKLGDLQLSYTDKHPDVIRVKEMIADIEAKYKTGELKSTQSEETGSSQSAALFIADKTLASYSKRRMELKVAIRDLVEDIDQINQRIEKYQGRIERTPEREEELMVFLRDYDNIKKSYSSLLNRKLEAEISVNMEKKQKGEQFQILDPATLPRKPLSPDMTRLFLVSLAAGLGIGGAIVFLLDFFNTSVKRPEEVERDMGIFVLATIPKIYQVKDFRRQRIRKVLTVCSLFITACLLAGFAALVFIGPEITLEAVNSITSIQTFWTN